MGYDFSKYIERRGTDCWKWDNEGQGVKIPMGCADTDFLSPKEVVETISEKVGKGLYTYGYLQDSFNEAIAGWFQKRHNVTVEPEWIMFSPGVMVGLKMTLDAFTNPGDQVIIQSPVFNNFKNVIQSNGRFALENDLLYQNNVYEIDFEDLEKKAAEPRTRAMVLCNPHNPVSKVMTRDELEKIHEICLKHNVLVISDEIHSDIVFGENKHIPFLALSLEAANNSIILSSPSKTFNLAGFYTSYAIIPDEAKRKQMKTVSSNHHFDFNFLGVDACQTAYDSCGYYVDQMVVHLWENAKYVQFFLQEKMPEVKVVVPQGTYLMWMDFSSWNLEDDALDALIKRAGVRLNKGSNYGPTGEGFMRMNIACPQSTLKEALDAIYEQYQKEIQGK